MTMLRYTGTVTTNFAEPRLAGMEPGDVFGVPDDEAERYLRRADIELADLPVDEPEAEQAALPAPESALPPEPAAAPEPSAAAE